MLLFYIGITEKTFIHMIIKPMAINYVMNGLWISLGLHYIFEFTEYFTDAFLELLGHGVYSESVPYTD